MVVVMRMISLIITILITFGSLKSERLCQLPLKDLTDEQGFYRPAFPNSEVFGVCSSDDFELVEPLGHGHFGLVYKAYHTKTRTDVAIKFQQHETDHWYHFNRNEECVMHELAGFPFIAQHFCTISLHNGTVGYVMELVPGNNLRHIVKGKAKGVRRQDLDLRKIMAQLAVTLEFVHDHRIVMADLKTGNLMVDLKGNIRLIDFGLAIKTLSDGSVFKAPEWISNKVMPEYGNRPATDWYSYGLILYELLHGANPFEQLKGKSFFRSPLLKGKFCPPSFSSAECDFIKHFSSTTWEDIWGPTAETRKLLREHPWFSSFDWSSVTQWKRRK